VNIRLARLVVGASIVLAAALGLASSARAQSDATSGTIEGVVSDATGGVLPGATVRLTNAATGFVREVGTGQVGGVDVALHLAHRDRPGGERAVGESDRVP